MSTTLLLYVFGSLLITVFGNPPVSPGPKTEPTTVPPPKPVKCGCNMTPTSCFPCIYNQVCNEPLRPCAFFCDVNLSFCRCEPGFILPTSNSKSCILKSECPPKPTTNSLPVG